MNNNPPITKLLRNVTALEVVVLFTSGGGLFFLPSLINALWPWPLAPFNMRFMGAVYLASLVAATMLTLWGRWSPARVVVPMILAFTVVVLATSIVYIQRFNLQSPAAWLWFVLYTGLPINALYHMWLYRSLPPAAPTAPTGFWRMLLLLQAVILGLYGIALIIAPVTASAFWPWGIDDFHGRMYSAASIAPAVGAWLLLRGAAKEEWLALGWTQVVGGIAPIAGLLIVDAEVHRVDWSPLGTWAWIGLSVGVLLCGVAMVWQGRRS